MPITLDGTSGITLPGTGTATQLGSLTRATAKTSTSGTTVEFDSIPSWVKRIIVMYSGVSLSGTSFPIIQLGTAPSVYTTSGYLGGAFSGGATYTNMSTGFIISNATAAADTGHGISTLATIDGLIWTYNSQFGYSNQAAVRFAAGSITMASAIDRLRITTVNGTDTFDAGTINIMYE